MQCLKPLSIRNPKWLDGDAGAPRWLSVPCGKCEACLSRRRQEWAFRLEREKLHSSSALFITLTYDEIHLPLSRDGLAHVSRRDCQCFLKRLRARVNTELLKLGYSEELPNLRYYLSSEYGPTTYCPHYHLLLFNFPLKYLNAYETILKSWNMGMVQVGPLRDGGAMYAAKYILHPFEDLPPTLTKPFSMMSRRPGIGFDSITEPLKKYCNDNKTYLVRIPGGRKIPLPRYFRTKIFDEETLRELSADVVAESEKTRVETFWDDICRCGKSLEKDRKDAYRRQVRKSLEKNKLSSKL